MRMAKQRVGEIIGWGPRIVFAAGVIALNISLAASPVGAQGEDKDDCYLHLSTQKCVCDDGPTNECTFDSECETLYPDMCGGPM